MYAIGTKLGVKEFFYTHVGSYYGSGRVFHHHWKNGPEIVSLEEFAKGRQVIVLDGAVDDEPAYYRRVNQLLANPKPYAVFNNCEHADSYVRTGVAASPQLQAVVALGVLVIVGVALVRGAKA